VIFIADFFPRRNFPHESSFVRNAAVKALFCKSPELGFREIQPAAVFWSVVPLETHGQASRLGRRKSLVEASRSIGIQIILDQHNYFGIGKMNIGHPFEKIRVIDSCTSIRDFDAPPPLKRSEYHEGIGCAVMLLFIIHARR